MITIKNTTGMGYQTRVLDENGRDLTKALYVESIETSLDSRSHVKATVRLGMIGSDVKAGRTDWATKNPRTGEYESVESITFRSGDRVVFSPEGGMTTSRRVETESWWGKHWIDAQDRPSMVAIKPEIDFVDKPLWRTRDIGERGTEIATSAEIRHNPDAEKVRIFNMVGKRWIGFDNSTVDPLKARVFTRAEARDWLRGDMRPDDFLIENDAELAAHIMREAGEVKANPDGLDGKVFVWNAHAGAWWGINNDITSDIRFARLETEAAVRAHMGPVYNWATSPLQFQPARATLAAHRAKQDPLDGLVFVYQPDAGWWKKIGWTLDLREAHRFTAAELVGLYTAIASIVPARETLVMHGLAESWPFVAGQTAKPCDDMGVYLPAKKADGGYMTTEETAKRVASDPFGFKFVLVPRAYGMTRATPPVVANKASNANVLGLRVAQHAQSGNWYSGRNKGTWSQRLADAVQFEHDNIPLTIRGLPLNIMPPGDAPTYAGEWVVRDTLRGMYLGFGGFLIADPAFATVHRTWHAARDAANIGVNRHLRLIKYAEAMATFAKRAA